MANGLPKEIQKVFPMFQNLHFKYDVDNGPSVSFQLPRNPPQNHAPPQAKKKPPQPQPKDTNDQKTKRKLNRLHAELNTAKQRENAALAKLAQAEKEKQNLDAAKIPVQVIHVTQSLANLEVQKPIPNNALGRLCRKLGFSAASYQELKSNGFSSVDDLDLIKAADLKMITLMRDRLALRKYLFED